MRRQRRGNVETVALAGDFKEILFADLLQFYCLSGQTAAVSVRAADERGVETTGTFFIDGGVLVDAVFDGREGSEAVRRAVRRLNRGAFQVELGARSERRTIHEPWSVLVLDELRQLESADMPGGMKSAAPALAAAFGRGARTPTPPGGTAAPSQSRLQTPPVGIRVTGTSPQPATSRPAPSPRGTPAAGTPAARRTPPQGTTAVDVPKGFEPAAPSSQHPARTVPGSGPHPEGGGLGTAARADSPGSPRGSAHPWAPPTGAWLWPRAGAHPHRDAPPGGRLRAQTRRRRRPPFLASVASAVRAPFSSWWWWRPAPSSPAARWRCW